MESIRVYDNVIPKRDIEEYRILMLNNLPFFHGERDTPDTPPSGLVCDFGKIHINPNIEKILNIFISKIYEKDEKFKSMQLYRVYLNYFSPTETPYFHTDGDDTTTCLYYINQELDYNEGGETQFLINDEIKGVTSQPGKLVIFDGKLLHRATSFRSHPRLTLAVKFYK